MLDAETKRRINAVRGALVGQVPDPLGQARHITAALMHRFMSDRDRAAAEQGGKPAFFVGPFAKFAWGEILNAKIGGHERVKLYREAVEKMADNKNLPKVFREMFRGAVVAFNDPQTLALFLREVDAVPARGSEDLGNAFEHILSILGAQGQAGQFRTPRHIIEFIVEVAAPEIGERILDPACGTAGFLIAAHKRILRRNSAAFNPDSHKFAFAGNGENAADAVYADGQFRGDLLTPAQRRQLAANIQGYDISPDMTRLSLVNMFLHGVRAPQIHAYDTLARQDKWDDDFEVILANPPFMSPRGGIQPHERFSIRSNRSEILFADYILRHLASKGRAGIIVPEGIIFQSQNAHKTLRKNLVENGLRAVVSLPGGIFNPYSGVKTSILFVDRARQSDEILFVRVENDGYELGAQRRRIEKNDLPAAFELLRDWANGIKTPSSPLAHLWVKRDAIADNEYDLTAANYQQARKGAGNQWPTEKLKNCCHIQQGGAHRLSGKHFVKQGGYPAYGAGGLNGHLPSFEFERPGIVLAVNGQCGRCYLTADKWSSLANTQAIFPNPDRADMRFVFHLLNDESRWIKRGTAQPYIRPSDVHNKIIPLPPLEFQRALAAELDGYQRVIDGARQVAESWRPRIPENAAWPLVKLGEICDIGAGNSAPQGMEYFKDGTFPFCRTADVGKARLSDNLSDIKDWVNEKGAQGMRFFPKGTILFPKSGASVFLNHRVMLGVDSYVSSHLATIRARPDKADSMFVLCALCAVDARTLTSDQNYPSLRLSRISEIEIRLPSLDEQQRIAAVIDSEWRMVESCRSLAESHAERIRSRVGAVWGE